MLKSFWAILHRIPNQLYVHTLEGPFVTYDLVPKNANLNENRKIKSILSVTAALSEYLLYLTFKPRTFFNTANVLVLLNMDRVK